MQAGDPVLLQTAWKHKFLGFFQPSWITPYPGEHRLAVSGAGRALEFMAQIQKELDFNTELFPAPNPTHTASNRSRRLFPPGTAAFLLPFATEPDLISPWQLPVLA